MMNISYESEDFPLPGPIHNGAGILSVSWNDILWAAITVGRPNRHYVFQHGQSSIYEALFRLSAVRMTIEQRMPRARVFKRTNASKNLDPSEKGAVNYFLGLTLCKLFAERLLHTPWLLHLDVFHDRLNPTLMAGRSRPDLVGLSRDGDWVVMESKGRARKPTTEDRSKAKDQAKRIVSISGVPVKWRIGGFSYFHEDALRFQWIDPQPDGEEPHEAIRLSISESEVWQSYYTPILDLIGSDRNGTNLRIFSDIYDEIARRGTTSELSLEYTGDSRIPLCDESVVRLRLEVIGFATFPLKLVPFGSDRAAHMLKSGEPAFFREADFGILIAPPVLELLAARRWIEAGKWCVENQRNQYKPGFQSDGLQILAGDTWNKPYAETTIKTK